jgi:hypothetical protein
VATDPTVRSHDLPSGDEAVEARTPEPPVVLTDLATSLLEEATSSGSGTSATSLTPGTAKTLTQTLVAVTGGAELDPGHWNGPGSVHVVTGSAVVTDASGTTVVGTGQWAPLGDDTSAVRADEDVVVLLTVAPR